MNWNYTPRNDHGIVEIKKIITIAAVCVFIASPVEAQTEVYGGYAIEAIYSADAAQTLDEDLDGSAIVGRVSGGVRFGPERDTIRVEASSNYYSYFSRKDRWANSIEAEKTFTLSDNTQLFIEAAGANNLITLERRDTDQVSLGGRVRFDKGVHRATIGTALRKRWYNDGANAWSPTLRGDYRYRIGSWHFVEFRAVADQVNSNIDRLNYDRLEVASFYTRPFNRTTRLRAGVTHRRWTWDSRFALDGQNRRDRLWIPQLRVVHDLTRNADINLEYRHVIRRSNDNDFDRSGNRISISFRNSF